MVKKLSYRQLQLLDKIGTDWDFLPGGIGCTNQTLEALERKELVQTKFEPLAYDGYGAWKCRRTPVDPHANAQIGR